MSTIHIHDAQPVGDDGQRPCARGERCMEAESVRQADGRYTLTPALGYRAFCVSDREFVLRCVEDLPRYFTELGDRIGDKATGQGPKVSGSRNSPILINLTVDELRVEMVNLVSSWAGRVYRVANLTGIDTERSLADRVRYGAQLTAYVDDAFNRMCETLGAHLDALLALDTEPMTRYMTVAEADELPDDVPVHRNYWAGYAEACLDRSGADAGLEIIRLNGRCRWILGYTGKDEKIAGRCFSCDQLDVLVRPDSSVGLMDHAECSACGTRYFGAEYANLLRDTYERELAKQREKKAC